MLRPRKKKPCFTGGQTFQLGLVSQDIFFLNIFFLVAKMTALKKKKQKQNKNKNKNKTKKKQQQKQKQKQKQKQNQKTKNQKKKKNKNKYIKKTTFLQRKFGKIILGYQKKSTKVSATLAKYD